MSEIPAKRVKVGGRQKGTLNKATSEFRLLMQLSGFILPTEIIALLRETDNDLVKYKCLELLAQYSYSKPTIDPDVDKRETIDVNALAEKVSGVSIEELERRYAEEKKTN